MAETHGYGSSDPTLARPGHSGGETAGSRVVESLEWDCAILDEVDDVHWSGGVYSCSREGARVVCHGCRNACTNWSFDCDVAVKQLSGKVTSAEISTDVAINVQLGGVQLYFVLIMLCTGRGWNRMAHSTKSYFPMNDATLMMTVGLAVSLATKDVAAEAVWESSRVHSKVLPRLLEGTGTQRSSAGTARDRE